MYIIFLPWAINVSKYERRFARCNTRYSWSSDSFPGCVVTDTTKKKKNYWFWILWIWIKVRRLIRPKMINMIMNKLLPKNMCIKRKWDKFKTFLIIYTLSWNKKLQCDNGLLSSYRSLHWVLLQMSSHNHEYKRLYVTTYCIKISMM